VAWTDRRPPAGFVRRLRQLADVPDLAVVWDADETESTGLHAWKVLSVQAGEVRCICTWRDELDGNLEAIANSILRWDYRRNGGPKAAADRLISKQRAERDGRRRALRNQFEGFADYARKRYAAVARGEVPLTRGA
jgi:hypothetical protein